MKTTQCVAIAAAILCLAPGVRGQDEKVSSRDVPEVVRKAFANAYPTATVKNWDKEKFEGKPVYEAESTDGKVNRNVMYSPDGKVVQIEETMQVSELAVAITDAVKKESPNAVISSAEKVTHGDAVEYKLSLKNASKKRLVLRADGTVVK